MSALATALFILALSEPSPPPQLIETDNSPLEASAIDLATATRPDGRRDFIAIAYTVHKRRTLATRWTTPAYTMEFLSIDCERRTTVLRRAVLYSGVADPSGPHLGDAGPVLSVEGNPRRTRQLDAVCSGPDATSPRYSTAFDFMAAHGIPKPGLR